MANPVATEEIADQRAHDIGHSGKRDRIAILKSATGASIRMKG